MPAAGEQQVGRPHGEEGGDLVLPAQRDAGIGKQVVDEDQQNGKDEAGALAAAPRGHAQRNAHQHQHQAGRGIGKRLCNSIRNRLASGPWVRCQQRLHGQGVDRRVQPSQVHVALLAQRQRHIGGGKGGDVVLSGWPATVSCARAVAQPHQQFLGRVADHRGRGGGGDLRVGGIGDVGHEDLAPVGRARPGAHVLHIENKVLEVLVEDARLNLVGGLRGLQCLLHLQDGLVGARSDIEGVGQPEQRAGDGHDGSDAHKVADAQAGGAHGDDFAVGGQPAEPQQHAHQHRHGNGDLEEVGQREEKNLHHVGERGAVADHHLQDVRQVLHEENEGEERAADERVGENLAEDVAGKDAHRQALRLVYRAGCCAGAGGRACQPRSRRLLPSTQTELRAMAAAASQG